MTPISIISHLHNRDYFHFEFYIQVVFFWVSWSKDWSLASSHGHKCNMLAITPHTLYMHRQKRERVGETDRRQIAIHMQLHKTRCETLALFLVFFPFCCCYFSFRPAWCNIIFWLVGKDSTQRVEGVKGRRGGVCVGSGRENQLQLQLLLEAHHE